MNEAGCVPIKALHISPVLTQIFRCFLYSWMIFSHGDEHASTSLIWQKVFPGLCYLFRHLQLIKLKLFALRHVSHVVGVSSTAARRACSLVSSNKRSHHFSKANLRPWVACGILSPSPSARTALIYIGGKQRDLHRQDHRNVTIAKGAECRKKGGI